VSQRHQRPREFFLHRFDQVRKHLLTDQPVSESRRLLIGSYFTQEYALESAALFNPSMVWHPDQSGLPPGSRRFILSLRATGAEVAECNAPLGLDTAARVGMLASPRRASAFLARLGRRWLTLARLVRGMPAPDVVLVGYLGHFDVHLAKLLKSGGNLLLLDEPTNDLDVDTLRALEDALLDFAGCAVVITHDRWFLDRVATHILAFEGDSQATWFEGSWGEYAAWVVETRGPEALEPHRIAYKPLVRPA
jgi:hypothetical protein